MLLILPLAVAEADLDQTFARILVSCLCMMFPSLYLQELHPRPSRYQDLALCWHS